MLFSSMARKTAKLRATRRYFLCYRSSVTSICCPGRYCVFARRITNSYFTSSVFLKWGWVSGQVYSCTDLTIWKVFCCSLYTVTFHVLMFGYRIMQTTVKRISIYQGRFRPLWVSPHLILLLGPWGIHTWSCDISKRRHFKTAFKRAYLALAM